MNKDPVFAANTRRTQQRTDVFFEKAAFGVAHFDGAQKNAAITEGIRVLEDAQASCCNQNVHSDELAEACGYLSNENPKVRPLTERFWRALVIDDQALRFEASAQALRVIRQQFGCCQ